MGRLARIGGTDQGLGISGREKLRASFRKEICQTVDVVVRQILGQEGTRGISLPLIFSRIETSLGAILEHG